MQQSTALQLLKSGKSIFLTGSAGTGKTYVLNQYIQYLRKRNISVAITASTGIAATHLNGQTIHAWSGIGIKSHLTAGKISLLLSKKKFKEQLQRTQVLIIDEISMLHKDQLQLIHQILQAAKSSEHPFGGMQVIFSGDFFQLPPIGNYGETNKDKFAFMSPVWIEAIKTNRLSVCYLTQQYRQEDNSLNQLLDEIRQGAISPESKAILKEVQANSVLGKNEIPKLYSHNSDVSIINNKMLNELPGSKIPFVARTKGKKGAVEFLKKSANVAPELFLKKGAKVMFVKNNSEKGYANGTLGEVERFNLDGAPVVLLKSGRRITPEREKWSIEDDTGHEDTSIPFALGLGSNRTQKPRNDLRGCRD
jgi:ATP-dependent exoDNAse (exonuclease V) alpha subunit